MMRQTRTRLGRLTAALYDGPAQIEAFRVKVLHKEAGPQGEYVVPVSGKAAETAARINRDHPGTGGTIPIDLWREYDGK